MSREVTVFFVLVCEHCGEAILTIAAEHIRHPLVGAQGTLYGICNACDGVTEVLRLTEEGEPVWEGEGLV